MKEWKPLLCSLLLWLPAIFTQAQTVFTEGFEDHLPGCYEFKDACIPGWINTHGTAHVVESGTSFNVISYADDHHAHVYVTKNNNCLPDNSADRGEGMALNFDFEAGQAYKMSYALLGKVSNVTWYLTNGLVAQSGIPSLTCVNPGTAIPPTPAGSQAITPSVINLDNNVEWTVYETDWFVPTANFSQLWFRASNLNSPLNIITSQLHLDEVIIEKKGDCEFKCPPAITDLNACIKEDNFGSIAFDCEATYSWDLPAGSTGVEFTTPTHSAILQASPGTYTVTIVDANNCEDVQTFEVVEDCCEKTQCLPPVKLVCDYTPAGVELLWSEVPGAAGYIVEIIFDDSDCGCGSGGGTFSQSEVVNDNSFLVSGFFIPCFSWKVITVCSEEEVSAPSEEMCFSGLQDCFPKNGFDGSDTAEFRSQQKERTPLSPKVYPNPILNEFHFALSIEEATSLTIELYDVNGKRLYQLHEEEVAAGVYQKTWTPPSTLANGIYFVKFQTATASSSKTVIVSDQH